LTNIAFTLHSIYQKNEVDMNTENQNNFFNIRELIYLMYNGMATAGVVHNTNMLIDKGYDRDTLIILLMWATGFVYSAQRLYDIYKNKKENQNNQNNQHQR
jgi:hypothetical protein